jgi:hypothetical protein
MSGEVLLCQVSSGYIRLVQVRSDNFSLCPIILGYFKLDRLGKVISI